MQLTVSTFRTDCTDKQQALKVLEETNEAYAAWADLDKCMNDTTFAVCPGCVDKVSSGACANGLFLADELADTITACANLADRYGLDLQAALGRVERKNRERGRYDATP